MHFPQSQVEGGRLNEKSSIFIFREVLKILPTYPNAVLFISSLIRSTSLGTGTRLHTHVTFNAPYRASQHPTMFCREAPNILPGGKLSMCVHECWLVGTETGSSRPINTPFVEMIPDKPVHHGSVIFSSSSLELNEVSNIVG